MKMTIKGLTIMIDPQDTKTGYIIDTDYFQKELPEGEYILRGTEKIIIEYEHWDELRHIVNTLCGIKNKGDLHITSIVLKGPKLPQYVFEILNHIMTLYDIKLDTVKKKRKKYLNIETDKYIIEDGIVTKVNDFLNNIILPNGVVKIGYSSFYSKHNLKSVTIPETVKIIGVSSFEHCDNLNNVILSDGLINIKKKAFHNCTNLESIILPKTVKTIGDGAFKSCSSLKSITLSDGLERIGESAFKDCENIESIVIPKTVKTIGYDAFKNCSSLKEVKLFDGLRKIYGRAFYNCVNLTDIVLPSSIQKIRGLAFEKCLKLKNITIRYKSYKGLINLIKNNDDFFCMKPGIIYKLPGICPINYTNTFGFKNKKINLIFEGPELSIKQKLFIIDLIVDKKSMIEFKVNNSIEQTEKEESSNRKKYDDDIENLLNKINDSCSYLSTSSRNNILSTVNKLLNTYEKDLDNLKPEFKEINDIPVEIGLSKDIRFLKPKLLTDLEMIILNLSSADTLIRFLEELNSYKKLLDTDVDSLSESNSVEGNIKNIIYLSKYLDNNVLDKLSKYIESTINKVSLNITKMYDENDTLILNYIDYKQEFELYISNLYDEVNTKFNMFGRYRVLLDSLTCGECEFSDNNGTLVELINSTRYSISKLLNSTYRRKMEEEFNKIKQKYIEIINNNISDDKYEKKISYEALVIMLRKDLTPLLIEINKYAYLDEYEKDKGNKNYILEQIHLSKDIAESLETDKLDDETSLQPITAYVIEIINKLMSNEQIDFNTKLLIKSKLNKKLDESIERIQNKTIKSLDEYNEALKIVIGLLVDIDLSIDYYVDSLEEYNIYSK